MTLSHSTYLYEVTHSCFPDIKTELCQLFQSQFNNCPFSYPRKMVMAPILQKYRSEELIAMFPVRKEPKRRSKYLVYTLAGFVTLLAVCLAFASTVLKVRNPKLEMISAKVMHISYSTSPSASFNVTMIASLTIMNPNFGRFNYDNSTVNVLYGVISVGARETVGARVEARETKEIDVMVNMRSSKKLLASGNLTNDIHSGTVKLRSYAKLSGTVQLLKIVKKRKTIVMACIMNLNLTSHSIHHVQC